MSLARLADPTLLTDQVFRAIQDAIMSGDIPAGSRLRLRDLAGQLGTSPMPVREALGRLEQVGLVERSPHRGAVVANLSPGELAYVYDARIVLEVEAARLGAVQIDEAGVNRMRAEQQQLEVAVEDGRVAEALDRDEALLTVLYTASDNPVIVELVQGLWRRCRTYKLLGSQPGAGETSVPSFQVPLIDAAAAHDADAAAELTRRSLDEARDRIRELLRAGSAAAAAGGGPNR